MTPEQWQHVKDLLDAALERPAADRSAYLDQACSAAPELRLEVEALIRSHEQAGSGFLSSAATAVRRAMEAQWPGPLGARIGPYRIIEKLGFGGMGAVYRAVRDDDQYQKQVAIKLIRPGIDSEFVVSRFRSERQILASLEHPNIARLLDGGATEDGLPYFVMELIEGSPIDEHCDNKKLTITERLRLFQTVCSAVQYAHQHLVVHRDIKPGNILITRDGTAKLLDFGIAKLLSSQESGPQTTLVGMRMLTPEYASPEQLRGEAISTASDVYSLGLVLYRLLTGHSAYRLSNDSLPEIIKAVTEGAIEKPSSVIYRVEQTSGDAGDKTAITPDLVSGRRESSPEKLARRLSGDLDNIVLKALRKEPGERYASVEQLSEDVRRHLVGLPIIARQGTAIYRLRKFIDRHRVGMAATAAVFVALMAGIGMTLREAHVARVQQALAERRFNDVRAMAHSNLFELNDALQKVHGSAVVQHLVIQRALEYLDKLSQESSGNHDLLRELAAGYVRIADLQGNFKGGTIGDSKAALASYRKAQAILEPLMVSSHYDVRDVQAEITLLPTYTLCLVKTGETEEALRISQRLLTITQAITKYLPHDPAARLADAYAHSIAGVVLGGSGASPSTREISEAIGHDREALKIVTELAATNPGLVAQDRISLGKLQLGFHLSKTRNFGEAARVFDDALVADEIRHSPRPIADIYVFRAMMYERMGDGKRALVEYENSFPLAQAASSADPSDLDAKLLFAVAKAHVAIQRFRLEGRRAELKRLEEAVAATEPVVAADPANVLYGSVLLMGYGYCGELLSAMGSQTAAQQRYTQALATATAIAKIDPQDLESRLVIAKLHASLGVIAARAARNSNAKQELANAQKITADLLELRPKDNEGLYLSKAIQDDLQVVKDCPDGHLCKNVKQLELPTLLN